MTFYPEKICLKFYKMKKKRESKNSEKKFKNHKKFIKKIFNEGY